MIKISGGEDFYPTPLEFIGKITKGINWNKIQYALEPSAGKGNIAQFLKNETKYFYLNVISKE